MQMTHLPAIEHSLKIKPVSLDTVHRYFKLCLSYVEYVSPADIYLETGRLMRLLSQYPLGLTREELLRLFYDDYAMASFNKQSSLKICLEKIIQRARSNFEKYNLGVFYCKQNKKYYLNLI
ncbi:MAG: hypothetical protein V4591_01865 [Bdellovibrionota bacterium]